MKSMIRKERVSFAPKELVSYFYNQVKFKTSLIVVLLAIIIETLMMFLFGFQNIGTYFLYNLLGSLIVSWLILGLVFYVIVYFVRGADNIEPNTYERVLGGLSAFRVVNIFMMLVIALIILIFMPSALSYFSSISANPALAFSETALPELTTAMTIGFILGIIFLIATLIYCIIMLYHLVAEIFDTRKWWMNIIWMIVYLVVSWIFAIL